MNMFYLLPLNIYNGLSADISVSADLTLWKIALSEMGDR